MPNRSKSGLPVIYVDAQPNVLLPVPPSPSTLGVFDVTYLHFHSIMELGLCLRGNGICCTDEGEQPFSAGDVQILFPFQKHLSKNTGAEPCLWCWLNIDPPALLSAGSFTNIGETERWIREEMGIFGIIDKKRYPEIYRLTETLVRISYFPDNLHSHREEYAAALFLTLLAELSRASYDLPKLSIPNYSILKLLSPAFDSINADIERGRLPAISHLPSICFMSPANFRRTFKAAVGCSARDYAITCAIRRACKLLTTTDTKIIDISEVVGFESVSGFDRCFLRQTGMTPQFYRKLTRSTK